MDISQFTYDDREAVANLWNRCAPALGFAQLNEEEFERSIIKNLYFRGEFAFTAHQGGAVCGFICGVSDAELPGGAERGYFTCLLLDEEVAYEENAEIMLLALEQAFYEAGVKNCDVLFFNPMRLPWTIPGTPGHLHNNAPGIWVESPQYQWFLSGGYVERARECAYYLNLDDFVMPGEQADKEKVLEGSGYRVGLYDGAVHEGLKEMLRELGNPVWEEEIQACGQKKIPFLAALQGSRVVGFAGPIYPEPGGRGYFTGIGVVKAQEGRGLGSLLFYKLCGEEKRAGALYMSLFTGEDNPAGRIYKGAGFQPVRRFAIMRKNLDKGGR